MHFGRAAHGLALLASPLFLVKPLYFYCVVGGYWSHLWIDMLNIRGADLLWSSPIRAVLAEAEDPPVELSVGEDKAESMIPEVLRRYL